MMKNGENVVMIHTCQKLFFNNINLIYSVTGKLTNHKGLYNRNIFIKFLKIINRKHICICVSVCFAVVLAYLDFMSNLCNGNTTSTLILLTSHLKLAYLSTLKN